VPPDDYDFKSLDPGSVQTKVPQKGRDIALAYLLNMTDIPVATAAFSTALMNP